MEERAGWKRQEAAKGRGRKMEAGRKGRMEEAGGRKRKEAPYNPGQLSALIRFSSLWLCVVG